MTHTHIRIVGWRPDGEPVNEIVELSDDDLQPIGLFKYYPTIIPVYMGNDYHIETCPEMHKIVRRCDNYFRQFGVHSNQRFQQMIRGADEEDIITIVDRLGKLNDDLLGPIL